MLKVGSCAFYVQGLGGEQDALAQKLKTATPEHLPLHHLDAVHHTLGGAVAPGRLAGSFQFSPLMTQPVSKFRQMRQPALAHLGPPCPQFVNISFEERLLERCRQLTQAGKLGKRCKQLLRDSFLRLF